MIMMTMMTAMMMVVVVTMIIIMENLNGDGDENVISKCNFFLFLKLFRDYSNLFNVANYPGTKLQ